MDGHRFFRALTIVAFGATYITVLLGGNVMASGSGLACPDWPTCNGTLIGSFSGSMGIEWSHRVSALILSLIILALSVAGVLYESRRPVLRGLALGALGLVIAEALLGGLVIHSQLAVTVVLAHFTLATVLFALLLLLAALANLREIPRRWVDWAWRASDTRVAAAPPTYRPAVPVGPSAPGLPGTTSASSDR